MHKLTEEFSPVNFFDHNFNQEKENKILNWLEKEIGFENFLFAIEREPKRLGDIINRERLNLSDSSKVIIVAGTNGKGQTCKNLAQICKHNQKNYTLFSSPHIFSIRERFELNGEKISYKDLEKLLLDTKDFLGDRVLSFFEFLFLCFSRWSASQNLDYVILEVGLGGRLDATNLIDCDYALMTSIGRDHQQYLGFDLKSILKEKFAVSRSSQLLVSSLESEYLRWYCSELAFKKQAYYIDLYGCKVISQEDSFHESNWKLAEFIAKQENLDVKKLVAYKKEWIVNKESSRFYFYGSHNPQGVRKLISYLCREGLKFDEIILSFSLRELSDIQQMLSSFLAYASKKCKIWVTENTYNANKTYKITKLKTDINEQEYPRVQFEENWNYILSEHNFNDNKKTLVVGSYYFIAPFISKLHQFRPRKS